MRNEILSALEKNSKLDTKELSVLLGKSEVEIVNEITESNFKLDFVLESDIEKQVAPIVQTKKQSYFQDAVVNSNLTFDNFVVGDFNKEAHQAALYVAQHGGTLFNPLLPLLAGSNNTTLPFPSGVTTT